MFSCARLLLMTALAFSVPLFANEAANEAITEAAAEADGSIDAALEALDREIMLLDADLQILEEDLLYPASSRVAVYLSMDLGELFALDSVTVKLNGAEVAHYLYTERQREALFQGGVQSLFVGNARQGENELTAFFVGEGPHEREYRRATTIRFEQSFEPVFVELSVTDRTASRQPEFAASVF